MSPETASLTNPYPYVSFSPPASIDYDALLSAPTGPMESRTIPTFDYRGWLPSVLALDGLTAEAPAARPGTDTAEIIFELLAQDRLRNGPLENMLGARDALLTSIRHAVAASRPIEVVIPSFAGRPVNLLRHTRQQPDLGEAAALAHLWGIHQAVRRRYDPGMRWHVVMDGVAYSRFYGYASPPYRRYQEELRAMAEALGVDEAFTFVDLDAMVAERQGEFDELHARVVEEVGEVWARPDYTFRDELTHAMKLGANTAPVDAAALHLVTFPAEGEGARSLLDRLSRNLAERAGATAFAYTCFLVTARRLDLFSRRFPHAIRGTVHPKPGQYSPHLVNHRTRIVPWHGVAVRDPDGVVRSVYESEVLAEPHRHRAVYLESEYTPLFYERRER